MTLIRRSNDLFPTFFDDFFGREGFFNNGFNASVTTPAVNIKEDDNGFHVEMAAPGMSKKDFKLELDNDILTISYEKEEKKEDKDAKAAYTKREFNYTSFQRSFALPKTVASDNIEASYKEGILRLYIPKKEEARQKPARMIDIS